MRDCIAALAPYIDFSLEDVLTNADSDTSLDRVDVVQPALFAMMVSLAALWCSFGVKPQVVVGHSQGEIAAAVVSGALSLEDGARITALRAKAIADELAGAGGMLSIALPSGQVEEYVKRWTGRISIAAVNGPASTVVSGESSALAELLAFYRSEGVRAREIAVDYASHSAQVERLKERLKDELGPIRPRPSEIPFCSAVTGGVLDTTELDAAYWYRNLRHTVRFDQAARALIESSYTTVIEISPHPVMTAALEEIVESSSTDPAEAAVIGSVRRGEAGMERVLTSIARAHAHGVAVDWSALFGDPTHTGAESPDVRLSAQALLALIVATGRRSNLARTIRHRAFAARRSR